MHTSVENVFEDFLRRFIVEWWNSSHEFIETHAESPPVDCFSVAFPVKHKKTFNAESLHLNLSHLHHEKLWSQIIWSAENSFSF